MRDDSDRVAHQLTRIAAALDVPCDTFSTAFDVRAALEPRTLIEDTLTITKLLSSLAAPADRRDCVALIESFVAFRQSIASNKRARRSEARY